jgi:hypothetical protein
MLDQLAALAVLSERATLEGKLYVYIAWWRFLGESEYKDNHQHEKIFLHKEAADHWLAMKCREFIEDHCDHGDGDRYTALLEYEDGDLWRCFFDGEDDWDGHVTLIEIDTRTITTVGIAA